MNPKKSELKPKQEFPGSAGKGKLKDAESVSKPSKEFTGSDGSGGLPKGNC